VSVETSAARTAAANAQAHNAKRTVHTADDTGAADFIVPTSLRSLLMAHDGARHGERAVRQLYAKPAAATRVVQIMEMQTRLRHHPNASNITT